MALKLANGVENVILLFAAWRVGAAVTPINPSLTDIEVDRQLADSGARLPVTEEAEAARDGVATLAVADLCQTLGWEDLPVPPDSSALALLIYTSGTTGTPKGVMLDHANLEAMVTMGRDALEVGPADRSMLILPLFHANGIVVQPAHRRRQLVQLPAAPPHRRSRPRAVRRPRPDRPADQRPCPGPPDPRLDGAGRARRLSTRRLRHLRGAPGPSRVSGG